MSFASRLGERHEISILVCGRTGVGKSSVINFILGKDVCKVNDPVDVYDRQTSAEITSVEENMNGILVTIYESSALQDGTADAQKAVDDLYSKCRDVDLIIYCQEMTTVRMQPPEIECLGLITKKFGGYFWKKTVLVLTKANFVRPRRYNNDEDVIRYFRRVALAFEQTIQSEVNKHVNQPVMTLEQPREDFFLQLHPEHVESSCVDNYTSRSLLTSSTSASVFSMNEGTITVTAVPAGSARDPVLPGGKYFIGNLYVSCLERLPQQKVKIFSQATSFCSRFVSCKTLKPVESPIQGSHIQ